MQRMSLNVKAISYYVMIFHKTNNFKEYSYWNLGAVIVKDLEDKLLFRNWYFIVEFGYSHLKLNNMFSVSQKQVFYVASWHELQTAASVMFHYEGKN